MCSMVDLFGHCLWEGRQPLHDAPTHKDCCAHTANAEHLPFDNTPQHNAHLQAWQRAHALTVLSQYPSASADASLDIVGNHPLMEVILQALTWPCSHPPIQPEAVVPLPLTCVVGQAAHHAGVKHQPVRIAIALCQPPQLLQV